MLIIDGVSSGQSRVIRFCGLALAVFALAEYPRRPAQVCAEQTPKSFADAIELRSDKLIDFGR
jgi:hypothetical protein